jgi:hypothetical protein
MKTVKNIIELSSARRMYRSGSNSVASKEHWFWASLGVALISLVVAGFLVGESIRAWTQPRVVQVKGGLTKNNVSEIEYAQAAEILRGLIGYGDDGKPVLVVQVSAAGISIAGASPNAYEPFITALWQLPGMIPNATWEFDELCTGIGCPGGAVVAKAHAQRISVVMNGN